jgi:hypothetical protein
MVPSAIICPLSAILILILRRDFKSATSWLDIAGIASTGVVTVASVAFAEPTSVTMRDWSSDSVPGEYARMRNRWDRIHTVRSVSSLIALAAYILAALRR